VTASIERASPLAGWAQAFGAASADAAEFSIREIAFATQVNLRGDASDPAFAAATAAILGCALPLAANTWQKAHEATAIWLGPDEWLVIHETQDGAALAERLGAALQGVHRSIVDVSAARTGVEIGGAQARTILAKGCSLDLHARSFRAPGAAQTLLAKARVLIQCREAPATFRVFVASSFADYLAQWLLDAAAECAASRDLDAGRIAARLA
jgi:sarcosine oxidase, subunit gamma